MTIINISIPQPCHENWEAMTAIDKGKFCGTCQKKVHDFTKASDREIVNAFQQNQNLCGRFLNTQLDRDIIKPNEKSSVWLATTAAVVSLTGLGTQEAIAQGKPIAVQTDKKVLGDKAVENKNDEIEISGIVTDNANVPIPGVNVLIKGTTLGTQSDFEGKYTIHAKKGGALIFNFVGMRTQEINIDKNSKMIYVKMKSDTVEMSLGVVVDIKRRTFFGRIFHSIGNWFR